MFLATLSTLSQRSRRAGRINFTVVTSGFLLIRLLPSKPMSSIRPQPQPDAAINFFKWLTSTASHWQFTVRRVSTSANPLRTYWLSLNFVSLISKSRTTLLSPPFAFAYLYAWLRSFSGSFI